MEFGVHLPLIDFGTGTLTSDQLRTYARIAAELGYTTLAANDHLVWRRPWLDGPTALTSVVDHTGPMALATSIALVAVRHPVVVAKWLTTLGHMTDSRIIAGLGPGSTSADYAAVGVPFDRRWARFDEAFRAVKALVRGEPVPVGQFYDLAGVRLAPLPARAPEVWFGSWGSDRRLRALAQEADGWFASAYNTTPGAFAEARTRLDGHLAACGRTPQACPDIIATMWLYVAGSQREADRMLTEVLAPVLGRDADELAARLPIGTPDHCIALLRGYAAAGAQQVLLWPIHDPIDQLRTFDELVRPGVALA
ncbi:MAG TPA: LLM class flavin-dependent oxidoreductase [Euzebyales bacterium]|nr:LLM class flavin-dependent oxidoreductase [Euzebyales bacterium]